ncbi:MAG: hypothetical protein ABW135_06420 [Thermoleophilaceae bacterium]
MPGGLSRRIVALAAAAFAVALGLGYMVSSSGGSEPASAAPLGSAAVTLDVPAASTKQATLGDAQPLPGIARRPPPPPAAPAPVSEPDSVEPVDEEPAAPEPAAPPVVTPPAPDPAPAPAPTPPPVDFDDSG